MTFPRKEARLLSPRWSSPFRLLAAWPLGLSPLRALPARAALDARQHASPKVAAPAPALRPGGAFGMDTVAEEPSQCHR